MSPRSCLITDEGQRDLATNRLLEIIRGGKDASTKTADGAKPESTKPGAPPQAAQPAPSSPQKEAGARATRPDGTPLPPTASAPTNEQTPARRPGMGLLDKVLTKSSTTPTAPGTTASPVKTPTSVSSMLSTPSETSGSKVTQTTEPTPSVPSERHTDMMLPDAFLPLPQRVYRKIKAKFTPNVPTVLTERPVSPKPLHSEKEAKRKSPSHLKAIVSGKRIISVDIGVSSIKLVELNKQGHNYVISGLEVHSIPVSMRKNPDTLLILQGKLLREMLTASRIKGADIHLVISDKSAQARTVSVPSGAAKELVNAIKFQIKKDLPFPLDVCEISYRGFDSKNTGKQDIEILAVDRRAIESSIKLLADIDAVPVVITAPSASSKFLVRDYTGIEAGAGAVVVVEIGASHTTITIVEESRVVLSRTVATGGDDFTSALTGVALGPNGEELTDVQAEKYKIDVGLPSERDAGVMKAAIQMRPIAERISTEIKRSLEFYRRARTGGEIKKIIMAGGGSLMKRLPEFISENTGVDIVLGTPTARLTLAGGASEVLEVQATESGPIFMAALSVALDDGKELNMLPKSIQGMLKLRKAQGVIAPVTLGVVALLIVAYVLALGSRNNIETEIKKIQAQLIDLDQSRANFIASSTQYADLVQQLRGRQADYDSIRIGEPEIPRYLKAFSNLTPENVYLSKLATKFLSETDEEKAAEEEEKNAPASLSMESIMGSFTKSFGDPLSAANQEKSQAPPVKRLVFGRVIEVEGVIYPQGTMTDVQLVDFVFNLENSGHFRDVAVDSMSTTDDGRIKFRILCGM